MAKTVKTTNKKETDEEEFNRELNSWIKLNPTYKGFNTANYKPFMHKLAGVESSYKRESNRYNGKKHRGYFQIENLTDYTATGQFKAFFDKLSKYKKDGIITKADFVKGAELGYTEAQIMGMAWNQGRKAADWLHHNIPSTDGNGLTPGQYATNKIGSSDLGSFSDDFNDAISESSVKMNTPKNYPSNLLSKQRRYPIYNMGKIDSIYVDSLNSKVGVIRLKDSTLYNAQTNDRMKKAHLEAVVGRLPYKPSEAMKQEFYKHYNLEGAKPFKNTDAYELPYINTGKKKIDRSVSVHPDYVDIIKPNPFNKFGGIIPARHKFADGGISAPGYTTYGSSVNASDVDSRLTSADGEGIIGGSIGQGAQTGMMSGLGLGLTAAAAGLKVGTLAGSWLGPIGMAAGALIGGIVGIFGGRNKKRREERRRAEAIAQQQETNRQAIIGNMESKEESDVAQLRQIASNTPSEGTSFYTKFGGMIPHRKLFKNGGQIIQNSSNTAMAYGPSHENGGIAYGENAEIEGGEAIRQTSIGDQIYSDKLFIPGTRRTFADGAQVLSEIKGAKEQEVQSRGSRILGKLEQLDRTRVNKLKMGTLMRNIEKDAFYMDKSAGQVVVLDKKLNDLFNTQEIVALAKGLRGNPQIARMGGCIRKKYVVGGLNIPSFVTGNEFSKYNFELPDFSNVTNTASAKAFNNLNLAGLGINVLGTGLGMLSNALSARTARKSLDWQMRNLTPAKRVKLIAPRYSTDYNINSDLQDLATQERRVAQYIKSNTSNPILARNLITKTAIDSLALRNKLYSQKRDYQTQRWDANINARIQTDNQNRQNDYLDQIDLRNHNIQYLGAIGNVQMQRDANFNAYLGDLATAGHQYLTAKAYSTLWPTGVQRTMGTSLRCGGLIKGRRK